MRIRDAAVGTGDHVGGPARRSERLRTLWDHRRIVAASVALALLGFVFATHNIDFPPTFEPRRYEVGTASTTLFVDTPKSRVVDLADITSIEVLSYRAKILAELALDPLIKDTIAQRLGVPSGHVVGVPLLSSATVSGSTLNEGDRRAYVLRTEVPQLDGGANPIMTVRTTAPSPEAAARFANATVEALRARLVVVNKAQSTPPGRRLVIVQLSPAVAEPLRRGLPALVTAAAALGMVALSCALIIMIVELREGWRSAPRLAHD